MKTTLARKAMMCVVASTFFMVLHSCVNSEYELSEENIDTEVQIFQDGLSLPLGKTDQVTLESLLNKLDPETKEMLQQYLSTEDGKYGITYAGNINLSDTLNSITDMLKIAKIEIDEKFDLPLSDVNLGGVEFKAQNIPAQTVNIASMVKVPEIKLPHVQQSLKISTTVPNPATGALDLGFEKLDVEHDATFASLDGTVVLSDDFLQKYHEYATMDMSYEEIAGFLKMIPGAPALPALTLAASFDPHEFEIPVKLSLPKEIKSVKEIKLSSDAMVELDVIVENPLFTSGAIKPQVDVDLHNIFHLRHSDAGVTADDHLNDNFRISGDNGWKEYHRYHVESLALSAADWKKEGPGMPLVLDKTIKVTALGSFVPEELKTNLKHLHDYGSKPMTVKIVVKFNNFTIDNVAMEIEPIVITKDITMPIDVPSVSLPEIVENVEFVELGNPLGISLQANLPEAFKTLDLKLETLEVDLPDGLVVEPHQNYNAGKLTYNNVSLSEGLEDHVNITRLNLPAPVNGNLSYSDEVKVTAKAVAQGTVNSKDLLGGKGGNIDVAVAVDYAPVLKDYNVVIGDYNYDVKVNPIDINEKIPAEVGKMNEITVKLEGEPVIEIDLDYPTAGGRLDIRPKEEGLKIYFPEMLRFKDLDDSYNYNGTENSISFNKDQSLPKKISLTIDYIVIKPQLVEGEYYVKGQMKVEGGVRLVGTKVTKEVLDALVAENAKISFGASVPALKPATLAVDEYMLTLEKQEFVLPLDDLEVPEMIKDIPSLDLKDVYLDLAVDASSVIDVLGDVDMSFNLDVVLPKLIKVEGLTGENRTLKVEGKLDENNRIVIEPVHIIGFDLSDVTFGGDKVSLGEQKITVEGGASLKNVSVDLKKLDSDLAVSVTGNLGTKDSGYIEIEKVSAIVDYQLDPINQTIDISGLLGELGEKLEVIPDLHRFNVLLDLKTNLSLPVFAKVKLTPYKNGQPGESHDESLELRTSVSSSDTTHTYFFISNSEEDKPLNPDYQHLVIPILDYVKDMPDSIALSIEAGTKKNATFVIEPSADYVLKADYKLELPLELGADFKIEFTETIEAPDIVNQILAYGSIGLGGKVTNGLPIQLDLEFNLMDEQGNPIPLAEGAGKTVIKPCNLDGSAVQSDLNVVLGVKKGIEVPVISNIELKFTASSGNMSGVAFRPGNFLQVELKAIVPEGVKVDIKDLMTTPDTEEDYQ